jgi:hypothetical protein
MKWVIIVIYVLLVLLCNWYFFADRAKDIRLNKLPGRKVVVSSRTACLTWGTVVGLIAASVIVWGLLPGFAFLKFIFS